MGSNYFCFLICIVCPFVFLTVNADKRTEKCNSICRGIRFPANIGGCKCAVVLFTKRSSEFSRSMETEADILKKLRHQILGKMDANDSTEYEAEEESTAEKPEKSTSRLIRLIQNRILHPVLRDVDY